MTKISLGLFADRDVGKQILLFLVDKHKEDLAVIVCTNASSSVYKDVILGDVFLEKITFFHDDLKNESVLVSEKFVDLDLIVLAWWPYIVKSNIINLPKKGVVNFHPSLLPFNRGMNYNFWTIIEETPFGVSLHLVDETIDGGDILFQAPIVKDWTDTGATLYKKAQDEITKLFIDKYEALRSGDYIPVKQDLSQGSFHYSKELHAASKIDLDKEYSARDLLNICRARTFPPHPGAWFEEDGKKFEINIKISEV